MKKRVLVPVTLVLVMLMALVFLTTTLQAASRPETAVTQPQAAAAIVELISNGDFSSGFDPWWAGGDVTNVTGPGGLTLTLNTGGANPWNASVGQHNIPLQAGETYTLSFTAHASTDVTVPVMLQLNEDPWTGYFNTPVALTIAPQNFSYTFTPGESDPAATFQFQLGGQGAFVFYLADVSLLGPEPVIPPPTTVGEILLNGNFDDGLSPWWTDGMTGQDASSGAFVGPVTNGNTAFRWNAILGQHGISVYEDGMYTLTMKLRASVPVTVEVLLQENGGSYTRYFESQLPLTTSDQVFTFHFTSNTTNQVASFQFHVGAQGNFTFYADDISLLGPKADDVEEVLPVIRLNQTGYLPQVLKRATISSTETSPIAWTLYDVTGTAVLTGMTTVYGHNLASDEHVHIADFSAYQTTGEDYKLAAAGEESHPFDIAAHVYNQLKYDALAYFYHNRSGISITMPYAGDPQWTRAAGHIGVPPNQGDYDVPCFDQLDAEGTQWYGCDYILSPVGGWYDAGDHGKYVVNGGISLWTMLNQYERTQHLAWADAAPFADGEMNIPENSNGVADILDEARWQMEFMLAMQAPADGVFTYTIPMSPTDLISPTMVGGMVHHKIADRNWTGLGLAPGDDPQPRYLYPPSTAATLNMAATAAQCARIWPGIDDDFAAECLAAAETAWEAAIANPAIYARDNFTGSGPYDDTDVSDEFYWAAAELYLTTGDAEYLAFMTASPHYLQIPATFAGDVVTDSAMAWGDVAALGTVSLALVPSDLHTNTVQMARQSIINVADGYVAARDSEGYLLPYAPGDDYPWGSNSSVINNMIILALAYDFTADDVYFNAVSEGMDYLLGRNPMDQSYVAGYGERPLQNPHHRFWAKQLVDTFPPPYPGAVSGGPNSSLQDPYASGLLAGCPAQKCFVDHIESWSTNEITINWNAPFAWVTAFLDEQASPQPEWTWYSFFPVMFNN
jgi:endoglucanase